jgi:hypothetical protein
MKKLIVFILFIFSLFSCVDEYWPKVLPKYENALVVDGMLTNQSGPYEIRLSLSSNVNDPSLRLFGGCEVSILDTNNFEEIFTEISRGVYVSSKNGIQGEIGNSYKLIIKTPGGKTYESEYETLVRPTEIEDISSELEFMPHPDFDRNITGFRFFVSSETAVSKENYFLWKLKSTYKFNANYRIRFLWDGRLHNFENSDSLYTCYLHQNVHEIFLFNTSELSIPKVVKYPLHFVDTETKALSIRYSLLVNQLSLSKRAYDYWQNIKSLYDEQGDLHSRLPFQIKGNIRNINNEEEPVLGYFMVAGISEKRIFMNRPVGVNWYYADSCNLYPLDMEILYSKIGSWPLFLPGVGAGAGISPAWVDYQWCLDCTQLGGKLEVPEFWEEK